MAASDDRNDVLIIGGGVAGLTLAQGLKNRKVPFRIFERNAVIKPKGYRFRCVDAGLEALERTLPPSLWKLLEDTHGGDAVPNILFADAATSEKLRMLEAKDKRSYNIDRSWVRELMRIGIEEDMQLGKHFESYELLPEGKVRVHFADQSTATGRILIAADGVHSRVRRQFLPQQKLLDLERTTIWGRTPLTPEFESRFGHPEILAEHAATMIDRKDVNRNLFIGTVHWPQGGRLSTISPSLSDQQDYMFWALSFLTPPPTVSLTTQEERLAYCMEITRDWHKPFQSVFEMMEKCSAIPIRSHKPELTSWETDDRISFVGDAIHAMSPTGGSGGLTAVVDSCKMCDVLSESWDASSGTWNGLKDRLSAHESDMRVRAKGAIDWSFQGAKMLWAGKDWTEYSEVA